MTWEWVGEIRERSFGAPLDGGYTLERVGQDCGLATMDETLCAAGMGHFALLDEQFAAARAAARGDGPR